MAGPACTGVCMCMCDCVYTCMCTRVGGGACTHELKDGAASAASSTAGILEGQVWVAPPHTHIHNNVAHTSITTRTQVRRSTCPLWSSRVRLSGLRAHTHTHVCTRICMTALSLSHAHTHTTIHTCPSWSSRKRLSGSRNAPCIMMTAKLKLSAEKNTAPTLRTGVVCVCVCSCVCVCV